MQIRVPRTRVSGSTTPVPAPAFKEPPNFHFRQVEINLFQNLSSTMAAGMESAWSPSTNFQLFLSDTLPGGSGH